MYSVRNRDRALIHRYLAREIAEAYVRKLLEYPDQENSKNLINESKSPLQLLSKSSVLLAKFPNELLLETMSHLSPCAVTCFGLTCKRVYKIYKSLYPGAVSLDEIESLGLAGWLNRDLSYTCLGLLLSQWRGIGPHFRVWQPELLPAELRTEIPLPAWHFIPTATYGELINPRRLDRFDRPRLEADLYLRYQDYHMMHIRGTSYLPYPRNKTKEEWTREATKMVINDYQRHSLRYQWMEFWEGTTFFSRNSRMILACEADMRVKALAEIFERGEL